MSWQEQVVAHMRQARRAGYGFHDAWTQAVTLYPPKGRDCGPLTPSLLDQEESLVAFFRRVSEDAWFGRRPALQHFHPSLLIERDGSPPNQRHRKLTAV